MYSRRKSSSSSSSFIIHQATEHHQWSRAKQFSSIFFKRDYTEQNTERIWTQQNKKKMIAAAAGLGVESGRSCHRRGQ